MKNRRAAKEAVGAIRHEKHDSLDFFPTPPWATRALFEHILKPYGFYQETSRPTAAGNPRSLARAWEPAAGTGHMVGVLREYFADVHASDVHDYGHGFEIGSFVGAAGGFGFDVARCEPVADWIITNPPFNLADEFIARALAEARVGVAMFVRTQFLEGARRYREIYSNYAPTIIAQFAGRCSLVKGVWDPNASRPAAYVWLVWIAGDRRCGESRAIWVPPDAQRHLTRPDDVRRYAELVAS